MGKVLATPLCRLAFVHVDKPREYEDDDPKHEVVMIFDKKAQETPEFKAIVDDVNAVIKETWPKGKPKNFKSPFKTAEDYENDEGVRYKGFEDDDLIAFRASHVDQPGRKGRDPKENLEDGEIYSGCYARCAVDAYAYNLKSSKGVTFGLGHIQKLGDGGKLGGSRPSATDIFGTEVQDDCTSLPEEDSEHDDGDGGDGDIPF